MLNRNIKIQLNHALPVGCTVTDVVLLEDIVVDVSTNVLLVIEVLLVLVVFTVVVVPKFGPMFGNLLVCVAVNLVVDLLVALVVVGLVSNAVLVVEVLELADMLLLVVLLGMLVCVLITVVAPSVGGMVLVAAKVDVVEVFVEFWINFAGSVARFGTSGWLVSNKNGGGVISAVVKSSPGSRNGVVPSVANQSPCIVVNESAKVGRGCVTNGVVSKMKGGTVDW